MMQDCYSKSTWTHLFTIGSAENAVKNGGSDAYIRCSDGTTSSLPIPAGDLSSNYRAEFHGLKAATEHLIEEDCNQQNFVLPFDAVSALQFLVNGPTHLHTQQLHNSLCTLSNNSRVVLKWVLAHVGIARNKTADRLQRQQQTFLNATSPPHTKKSRPFWNGTRNQPGDWKTMDMTHRKTRLTP